MLRLILTYKISQVFMTNAINFIIFINFNSKKNIYKYCTTNIMFYNIIMKFHSYLKFILMFCRKIKITIF